MGDAGHVVPTARTLLRPVSIEDVGYLHRLWTDPAVRRFFWDDAVIPHERAEATVREAVEDFGRHGFGIWIAERREAGEGRWASAACGTSTTGLTWRFSTASRPRSEGEDTPPR